MSQQSVPTTPLEVDLEKRRLPLVRIDRLQSKRCSLKTLASFAWHFPAFAIGSKQSGRAILFLLCAPDAP